MGRWPVAMAADREKCLEAGMNDHLAKPIDPDKLFDALLRWIPARTAAPNVVAAPVVTAQRQPADSARTMTVTALNITCGAQVD